MPRVSRGTTSHRRHKALLEQTKGFRTGRRTQVKRASEALMQAQQFAYRDRRTKKRDFRRAWIVRINSAVRAHDMSYSQFMNALRLQNITLDRKVLADMALNTPEAFSALVTTVRTSATAQNA